MWVSFVVFNADVLPPESVVWAGLFRTLWSAFRFANCLNRLRREKTRSAQGSHRNESMTVFERGADVRHRFN